jgi:uncharacterized protein (TIGR02646 family)
VNPCIRGVQPDLLQRFGAEISANYHTKKSTDKLYQFRWPKRENQSLYNIVRSELALMTNSHCAYCDGYPITSTGEEQIDHFRPKSRKEFYGLVCDWDNLYLICSACNKAKLAKWNKLLLKPDMPGYEFTLYFSYRTDTGQLIPNKAATSDKQLRAKITIKILDLNRSGARIARRRMIKSLLATFSVEDLNDLDYRFLIPLSGK